MRIPGRKPPLITLLSVTMQAEGTAFIPTEAFIQLHQGRLSLEIADFSESRAAGGSAKKPLPALVQPCLKQRHNRIPSSARMLRDL